MKKSIFGLVFLSTTCFTGLGFAGGLDLTTTYSSRISAMGGGHISLATDAHAPYYNPAAMSFVNRFAFTANFFPLIYQNEAPVGADDALKKSKMSVAPLFYAGAVYRVHDRVHLGLAVYPTALQGQSYSGVDYNDNDLQDLELSIRLMRIEIAPSISVRLLEKLSAGASYRIGYTQYDKKAGVFASTGQPGGSFLDTTVNSWDAKGFKFGLHLEDLHGFSLGVSYRLQQKLTLSGTTKVAGTPIETKQFVTIPMRLEVGSSYRFWNERLTAAVSYAFTQNSKITFDDTQITGFPPESTRQPLQYRDGHSFYAGMDYRHPLSESRSFRVGAGYSLDTAVTNKRYPSPVLPPDAAYHGANIGGGYSFGNHEIGLSVNYGGYSSTTTERGTDPAPIDQTIFLGKYSTRSLGLVLDYQMSF